MSLEIAVAIVLGFAAMITDIWGRRADRYSEMRSEATVNLPKVEMSYIGG